VLQLAASTRNLGEGSWTLCISGTCFRVHHNYCGAWHLSSQYMLSPLAKKWVCLVWPGVSHFIEQLNRCKPIMVSQ